MRVTDLETRPDMSITVKRKLHDMRITGRSAGVRSTQQSVGILNVIRYIRDFVEEKFI